tara:strand:- start:1281 stop:1766 length:486 start_codon:yes stop_codon:yes gene_type:complete
MNLISGVIVKNLIVHQDISDTEEQLGKPGYLMEVLRDDDELLRKFGQTTFTIAFKNTIKAFHWHKKQDDLWFIATGKAVVVLHDIRDVSDTKGVTQIINAGKDDYKLILIPDGVVHGYKVLSDEPVILFYHTTESYNPDNPDEERIAWNDPQIDFDWDSVS